MTAEEIEKKALEYRNHTKEYGESNVEAYARQIAYEAGAHMRDAEVEELKKELLEMESLLSMHRKMTGECALNQSWHCIDDGEEPEVGQYVYTYQKMATVEDMFESYKVSQYLGNNRWSQQDGEYDVEFSGGISHWKPIVKVESNN